MCVKQVGLPLDEIEFTEDQTAVRSETLDHSLNEWDACALELALNWRDARGDTEVVVATCGDGNAEVALRRCLAMGADRAVRVEASVLDPTSIAAALAVVIRMERPDLVLCGVQSRDSAQGSTGSALAGLLRWPCATVVTGFDWNGGGTALVNRELNSGLIEVLEVDMPAVLTVQTGINRPRYVTLRAIKFAEKQEIGLVPDRHDVPPAFRIRRLFAPEKHAATMLSGNPQEIARQIADLIESRLK